MSIENVLLTLENRIAHLQAQQANALMGARARGASQSEIAQLKGSRSGMSQALSEVSSLLDQARALAA